MELKKLNALISSIKKTNSKLSSDVQDALKGVAFFAQRDRNLDPAKRLFEAVSNGVNKKAMSHWLSTYAPIHFKDEIPCLSDKRQKEFDGTIGEFQAVLDDAPHWTSFNTEGNKATNTWDTAAFVGKVDEYMLNAVKKLAKHDIALAEALDRAHNLMRAELSKVCDIVEK